MATVQTFDTASLPAARPVRGGEPYRFQVTDLLALIRRRHRLVASVAGLCLAFTALVLMFLPTLYSASAVVMLEQRKNNVADASSVLSSLPTDAASIQNQIQILTSRDLASQVVDKLGLANDPEFNSAGPLDTLRSAADADTFRERVVNAFLSRLSVENEGLSTAITISFRASSPEKAAQIANAVAETYVQSQLETKFSATRGATNWLEGRVRDLSHQVQAADAEVERYKAEHDLNESSGGEPLIDQQISAISTQLVQAKADLAQKQATFSRVDMLMKAGHGADISQAVASPVIIQLRAQEADLIRNEADLVTKYGPKHPKLIAVQSQRHDLEQKVVEEVARVAGSLANDVSVSRSQVASLEASLSDAEQEARTQGLLRVKLQSLEVNAASTHSIYEAFVARLRAIQDQSAIEASDARVISHAVAPNAPSSPHRMLIFAASIPASLMFGLLVALLAERFGSASQTPQARMRNVPVLAEIPGVGHPRAADLVLDWPDCPFAQATRHLAENIAYGAARGGPRVILVTSAQAGEGAGTIAVSLARAAAQLGRRVVLLDGNFAKPMLPSLAVARAGSGLADVLTGRTPLSRTLMRDRRSNLLLLGAAPARGGDAAPVFASRQFRDLLAHLRTRCDLLFMVAPPVLASANTQALVPHADAVMLVARADAQTRPTIAAAVDMLAAIPAPPIGLVLAA
jgi:succinoglycan biosynthesis transport protein ExoP